MDSQSGLQAPELIVYSGDADAEGIRDRLLCTALGGVGVYAQDLELALGR